MPTKIKGSRLRKGNAYYQMGNDSRKALRRRLVGSGSIAKKALKLYFRE